MEKSIKNDSDSVINRLKRDGVISDDFNGSVAQFRGMKKIYLNAAPIDPYNLILEYFLSSDKDKIASKDSESKLLIPEIYIRENDNDIPEIVSSNDSGAAILRDKTIIVWTKNGSELIPVLYSTVCHSLFLTFFSIMVDKRNEGVLSKSDIYRVLQIRDKLIDGSTDLSVGNPLILNNKKNGVENVEITGRNLVSSNLVNSFFGNISFRMGDEIYISQTGSYLDDLKGNIIGCSLKGDDNCEKRASSELPSHRKIYEKTDYNLIIHGHPKFTVILSMDCKVPGCKKSENCFSFCKHERSLFDIPVISGVTGSGKFGLDKVLPETIKRFGKAIVYGHGIFIAGKNDFSKAFFEMLRIERICKKEYFKNF